MGKSQKTNGITNDQILIAVRSRSEWAMRAVSIANPERVARIDNLTDLYDSQNVKLRAYVNASGVATLETNAEYKARRDAKTARKSQNAPAVAQPAKSDTTARDAQTFVNANKTTPTADLADVSALQAQIAALQAQIATLQPAPVAQPAPVKRSKVANLKPRTVDHSASDAAISKAMRDDRPMTDSDTKNATLHAIDTKLDILGKDREWAARKLETAELTTLSVRQLRSVNRMLAQRIASNAKSA